MWITELATKTITADSRIGSHSALSPVIGTSRRREPAVVGPPRFYRARVRSQQAPSRGRRNAPATARNSPFGLLELCLGVLAGFGEVVVRLAGASLHAVLR